MHFETSILMSALFSCAIASSDPNAYKNQSKIDDFEDETQYESVDLIDSLMKSRFYSSYFLKNRIQENGNTRFSLCTN